MDVLADLEKRGPVSLSVVEECFASAGLASALQAARSGGAIKCVQRAKASSHSLYAVQPAWRTLLRRES